MADTDSPTALAEFLLARCDEDEQVARDASDLGNDKVYVTRVHVSDDLDPMRTYSEDAQRTRMLTRHSPKRVLADIESKRRIIEQMSEEAAEGAYFIEAWRDGSLPGNNIEVAIWTLLTLAQPDAGHPDYREEWRL